MRAILILLILILSALAQAQTLCDVFATERDAKYVVGLSDAEAQRTLSFLQLNHVGKVDTTSLRKELKFVRTKTDVVNAINGLKKKFGVQFLYRDVAQPGTLNQTRTTMSIPARFKVYDRIMGQTVERTAKLRFRRYEVKDLESGKVSRAAITKEVGFLEFKIDHPEYEAVVTKHRFKIADGDVASLLGFNGRPLLSTREVKEIRQRVATLNPESETLMINQFFETIAQLRADAEDNLIPYVDISYERVAYEIRLRSTNGSAVPVQITVDRNVRYQMGNGGVDLGHYPEIANIVEVKIPLESSDFSAMDMENVPGLEHVAQFVDSFSNLERVPTYIDGKGKLANYRQGNYHPQEVISD